MLYVITELFISSTGGIVFDAANGVGVFSNYFTALRWLVKERQLAEQIQWPTTTKHVGDINDHGRVHLWTLTERSEHGYTHYYLSRVNENGFH